MGGSPHTHTVVIQALLQVQAASALLFEMLSDQCNEAMRMYMYILLENEQASACPKSFPIHYSRVATNHSAVCLQRPSRVIGDVCFFLVQIVTQPTHCFPTGTCTPSLIDVVFIPSLTSHSCTVLPPVGHNSILFSLPLSITSSFSCLFSIFIRTM